jgi:hypothetical protein
LIKYLNNQFLKIDFIDEGVDLDASPEANDYIGSARIPLKGMLTSEMFEQDISIMNEKGIETGNVKVRVCFYESSMRPKDGQLSATTTIGG